MDEENIRDRLSRNDVLVNRANDQEYLDEIRTHLNLPSDKRLLCMLRHGDDEFVSKGKYLFELKLI